MDLPYLVWSALAAVWAGQSVLTAVNEKKALNLRMDMAYLSKMVLEEEIWCVLAFVNIIVCLLFLFGKCLIRFFFKSLRDVEKEMMHDRLVNYFLMKTVFVCAVFELRAEGLLTWVAWFTVIGYLRIFGMLCRDRFEYLAFNPNTSTSSHVKIISLLGLILFSNVIVLIWGIRSFPVGWIFLSLFVFECCILFLDVLQTLIKYAIHLKDLASEKVWETRSILMYYTEFITDILIQFSTFAYNFFILIFHGNNFLLIDIILVSNIHASAYSLHKKVRQYIDFRNALIFMRTTFAAATEEEIKQYNDNCAICREPMETAKKLPCGHLFHLSCLRPLVAHQNFCPTCRHVLSPAINEKLHQTHQHDSSCPSPPSTMSPSIPSHSNSNLSSSSTANPSPSTPTSNSSSPSHSLSNSLSNSGLDHNHGGLMAPTGRAMQREEEGGAEQDLQHLLHFSSFSIVI